VSAAGHGFRAPASGHRGAGRSGRVGAGGREVARRPADCPRHVPLDVRPGRLNHRGTLPVAPPARPLPALPQPHRGCQSGRRARLTSLACGPTSACPAG